MVVLAGFPEAVAIQRTSLSPSGEGLPALRPRSEASWAPIMKKGEVGLIDGPRLGTRGFLQELAHFAVHHYEGAVLWCDGDHGFNPYDFAELNLQRGFDADFGADRVLVKRCMTPFQWDTVLTQHLEHKLGSEEACLVIAAPYDGLFSTDELQAWEQADYVAYSLERLRTFARRHSVPILLAADLTLWASSHAALARATWVGTASHWMVAPAGSGWVAMEAETGIEISSGPCRQTTIKDFAPLTGVSQRLPVSPRIH